MGRHLILRTGSLAGLGILVFGSAASAQQLVRNTANIPVSTGSTENVDFGDVDQDGDWDAVFADGGDAGNDQSKIWINQGGAQGGTVGVFQSKTSTQFPVISTDARDIEFVDFDNDSDVDIYLSNTSQQINQSNRWWANMGNAQGGTVGFYQDQSAARWSGLAAAGSSINPAELITGGFIDFSCDCDFGDIDNDGDIDLIHSSYGGAFGGNVPLRMFLNNGSGVFSEFNPSGFQLSGLTIVNGNPGIWAEGTQLANTTNSTGATCDVASSTLDIEIGDIDGDFDLDLLQGARQEVPRLFVNRLQENGGVLTFFRDVSAANFPAGYSVGNGHYANELGDQDGDGDLDIYGLNWLVTGNFDDVVMKNNGNGVFSNEVTLPSSQSDDNEGDFFDYDEDGDLDLFVANFSGQDRVYKNNGTGTYTYQATGVAIPADGTTSLDADLTDVDNDGAPDVFVANDGGQAEWYLHNTTTANDTFAPVIPHVEQAPNRTAGAAPTVVRAQVYDNAAYYVTWYNPTHIEVTVNGGPVTNYPAQSSQGQIFRAEIPGNLVGLIAYKFVSQDQYANVGQSAVLTYTSNGGTIGTPYCFGDGSGTACPCANNSNVGDQSGCLNSLGLAAKLIATGNPSVTGDTVVLAGSGMPNSSALYFQGTTQQSAGLGSVFGDGLRCAAGSVIRLATKSNAGNASTYPSGADPLVSIKGLIPGAGATRTYQVWYRNAAAFCNPETFNVSNGLQIVWLP